MDVIAIFDIGKTNKKFFLFDVNFQEVHREYTQFDEVLDDDGFPCDDLDGLVNWIKTTYQKFSDDSNYSIKSLNFSTYGASLVHLDEENKVASPFYNYLKPIPEGLLQQFLNKHGGKRNFELTTASPLLGMLNAGLQLYFIKHEKPDIFKKIKKSLHFPQYLSSLFTNEYVTDFTSLGCHTGLWDFAKNDYAKWVHDEDLVDLLCPIVLTDTTFERDNVKVGVGIHDSSAALIPYQHASSDTPFAVVSTGTWSICMNMHNHAPLTKSEFEADCLNFLSTKGEGIKASRLFLGKHLEETAQSLAAYFKVDEKAFKNVAYPKLFLSKRTNETELLFNHSLIQAERFGFSYPKQPDYDIFENYDDAIHHFFDEITDLQIKSLQLAIGDSQITTIYVDGGFSASELFIQFLKNKLSNYHIHSSTFPLGTALGAALSIHNQPLPIKLANKFLS